MASFLGNDESVPEATHFQVQLIPGRDLHAQIAKVGAAGKESLPGGGLRYFRHPRAARDGRRR